MTKNEFNKLKQRIKKHIPLLELQDKLSTFISTAIANDEILINDEEGTYFPASLDYDLSERNLTFNFLSELFIINNGKIFSKNEINYYISILSTGMNKKDSPIDINSYSMSNAISILSVKIFEELYPNIDILSEDNFNIANDFTIYFRKILDNRTLDSYDTMIDEDFEADFERLILEDIEDLENNMINESSIEWSRDLDENMKTAFLEMQQSLYDNMNISSKTKELFENIVKSNNLDKIITVTNFDNEDQQQFDIDILDNNEFFIGYTPNHIEVFLTKLDEIVKNKGMLNVREFTKLKYTKTINGKDIQIPLKNVYGVICGMNKYMGLPHETLKESYSIDAHTGEKLEHERDITYIDMPF